MDKSPDAFRTISEVADVLETPAHVLRFWESRFPQIRPVKRAGGRRYYRPSDVALLAGIKRLLHDEGLTIRGVQRILRDQGVRHVAGLVGHAIPDEALPGLTPEEAAGMAADAPAPRLSGSPEAEVPEAGFVDMALDPEDLPEDLPDADAPLQAVLPLFDRAPAPRGAPFASPLTPDLTPGPAAPRPGLAGLIRALPPGSLARSRPQIAALAARLAALRAVLAARADGSAG